VKVLVKTGSLEQHVFAATGFDAGEQCVRVLERTENSGHRRRNMFTVFKNLETMVDMARSVGGDEHSLDAVIEYELLEGGICLGATAFFRQLGAAVWKKVTHGNDLDVRVVLETELRAELALPISNDADANFPRRHRLPTFGCVWIFGSFFKTLNGLLPTLDAQGEARGRRAYGRGIKKGAPRKRAVNRLREGRGVRRLKRLGLRVHEPQDVERVLGVKEGGASLGPDYGAGLTAERCS
jgi:hypothetical protein